MKKVMLVVALCFPVASLFALALTPSPVTADNDFLESQTAMPDERFELAYDEATPVPFGFKMAAGDRMAVKFTPGDFGENMYPFSVDSACYAPTGWQDDPDNWDAECYLVFFEGGQEPGAEIGRKEVSASQEGVFNWFDVSDLGIEVTSGSFYYAVENKVDDNPGLFMDGGNGVHEVSWMYTVFEGETDPMWSPFTNINVGFPGDMTLGDSVDLMLRVRGIAPGGTGEVVELEPQIAQSLSVPSLLVSESTIRYTLAEPGRVELTVFDAMGRSVNTLYRADAAAGEHTLNWDGSTLSNGIYFINLKTAFGTKTAKVVLVD